MPKNADPSSELVELSKLNGEFRKNYGTLLGAYLYLRSISAARGHQISWLGLAWLAGSAGAAWFAKYGWNWWHAG
ncbi:hypothetical protein [Bradyrhizobium sp. STM 3557]|uniref:hypothetical protein n=1 Tax=Bradyrhizobium sp. STM 3557 TaxID=578920 RepID=UPI0038910C6F